MKNGQHFELEKSILKLLVDEATHGLEETALTTS